MKIGVESRAPVEIWIQVFSYLIPRHPLSPTDSSLIGAFQLFLSTDELRRLYRRQKTEEERISLVCRLFYHIIIAERQRWLLLEREGGSNGTTRCSTGCAGQATEYIHVSTDVDYVPSTWHQQHWPSLRVLVVGRAIIRDLTRLMDNSPIVTAVKCVSQPSSAHEENPAFTLFLHHTTFQRLTHLSLSISLKQAETPLKSSDLRFLHLDVGLVLWPEERAPEDILPWTFPTLRSLHVTGKMKPDVFERLNSFFQRHTGTVKEFADDIDIISNSQVPRWRLIERFPHLEVYGTTGRGCSKPPQPLVQNSTQGNATKPITVLLTGLSAVFIYTDTPIIVQVLSEVLAAHSTYSMGRLMLNTGWETLRNWAAEKSYFGLPLLFLAELQRVAASGFPLVDRDAVPFLEAKRRGTFAWFPEDLSRRASHG